MPCGEPECRVLGSVRRQDTPRAVLGLRLEDAGGAPVDWSMCKGFGKLVGFFVGDGGLFGFAVKLNGCDAGARERTAMDTGVPP